MSSFLALGVTFWRKKLDLRNIDGYTRESCWTESIAVGNRQFVKDTKFKLCLKAQGRKVVERNDKFVLKEPYAPYNAYLDTKKDLIRSEKCIIGVKM